MSLQESTNLTPLEIRQLGKIARSQQGLLARQSESGQSTRLKAAEWSRSPAQVDRKQLETMQRFETILQQHLEATTWQHAAVEGNTETS